MIDHETETLMSLAQAAKRLPRRNDGRPVHPATIARWTRQGIAGVKLEAIRLGRQWYTSIEACQRFFEALTRASGPKPATGTGIVVSAAATEEMRRLEDAGV
jgi:hypothetical protein